MTSTSTWGSGGRQRPAAGPDEDRNADLLMTDGKIVGSARRRRRARIATSTTP